MREKEKKLELKIEEIKTVHATTPEGKILQSMHEEQKSELKLQTETIQRKDQVI